MHSSHKIYGIRHIGKLWEITENKGNLGKRKIKRYFGELWKLK
jgi:hypothetical protein